MHPLLKKLLITAIVCFQFGCFPARHPGPFISTPLDPGLDGISLTIVRAKQFIGYYPIHYIAIDGQTVAALKTGQYTKIPVSKGAHELTVTFIVSGVYVITPFGVGATPEVRHPREHTAKSEFLCHSDDTCLFGIRVTGFAPDETPLSEFLPEITRIDKLDGEFSLKGKTFVSPGNAPDEYLSIPAIPAWK
jgi:hypothetical protein